MMTPQVAAMLQNNAGNAQMVSRIAQEQGLSQEEIAQALKIPAEAAARYVAPAQAASAALGGGMNPELGAGSESTGGMVTGGGAPMVAKPAVESSAPPVAAVGGGTPSISNAMPVTIADQGMKPAAPPPPTQGPQTKPMSIPAPGKPMAPQMGKPMMETPAAGSRPAGGFRQPMGRPNFAGSQRPQGNLGERAFVDAFNRMRGNVMRGNVQ